MFGRVSLYGLITVLAGLACASLYAQSNTNSASVFGASSSATNMFAAALPASGKSVTETPSAVHKDARVAPLVGTNYKIGADDVLTINVWHEPEVSRNVSVRPDGKISLPLIGDIQAAGRTPTQLQNELDSRFTKYLTNPDVSVIVAEIRSQRFNVLGQVLRPGTYPLIPPMSVIDAVATAGGLKEFAKTKKIYVLRALPNGQRERIKFEYRNVLKGKRGSKDLLLQTRDTVVVP